MRGKAASIWAQRATEWKASGLTSKAFCEGKDFNPDALRHWASKIRRLAIRTPGEGKPALRVARVVRTPDKGAHSEVAPEPLVVEIGRARVVVRTGFDRATLAALLELLGPGHERR
jgi:hypothetical protein